MIKPKFPLICIDLELFVELIHTEESLSASTVYALTSSSQREELIAYDDGMNKWSYEQTSDSVKNSFFNRLLAKTIYNPTVPVKVSWTHLGEYRLEELKKDLSEAIDSDDDILTQYADGETIKKELNKSKSFDEIFGLLKKYVFEVNEQELKSKYG